MIPGIFGGRGGGFARDRWDTYNVKQKAENLRKKQVEVEKRDTAESERQNQERWTKTEKSRRERESRKKGEDQRAEVGEMGERQRGIGQ